MRVRSRWLRPVFMGGPWASPSTISRLPWELVAVITVKQDTPQTLSTLAWVCLLIGKLLSLML